MTGPALNQVRTSIATILGAVAGIGQVHDFFRFTQTEQALRTLTVSAGRRHVWFVSLAEGQPLTAKRYPANLEQSTYAFELHGWMAVDDADATEKLWASTVEAVIAAFRGQKKLGRIDVIDSGPAQWLDGGYRMFPPGKGGALCHYARLALPVKVQTEC